MDCLGLYCSECWKDRGLCKTCPIDKLYQFVRNNEDKSYLWLMNKQPGGHPEKEEIMNTVNLIGRLTKDADVRTIKGKDGDISQATFTLAVDRGNDAADFIHCAAYGKTAEIIEDYTEKGVRIGVTGHIRTGIYENADGETVWTTDVIADRFDFADGKRVTGDPKGKSETDDPDFRRGNAKKDGSRGRR